LRHLSITHVRFSAAGPYGSPPHRRFFVWRLQREPKPWDWNVGTLQPGKEADIILLDLKRPHLTPLLARLLRSLTPNLVYSANMGGSS